MPQRWSTRPWPRSLSCPARGSRRCSSGGHCQLPGQLVCTAAQRGASP
jgi:hypothetical protein